MAVALLTAAHVVVFALLAAASAGKLARLDGVSYPAAVKQAAAAFTVVLTLVATLATAIATVCT
ncbi:hypothetical protein KDA82_15135 [Streptomyces daliensis]|uniref:Uncharacterized protein n=1 Tax=Streptomyces daliensis TaxID=299421 RepID=A0A8T4IWQ6_9ACTN|nr:hypothetical protein [Streptomyces daliensis]